MKSRAKDTARKLKGEPKLVLFVPCGHLPSPPDSVIAVYCPAYVNGINLPGWHFHYLSGDKTQGGHILGLSADSLRLKINKIERFDLTLPQNPEFAHRDLCEDLTAKTAAVEGVKK